VRNLSDRGADRNSLIVWRDGKIVREMVTDKGVSVKPADLIRENGELEELFVNLEFEWDAAKASENIKNHRVNFEEAKSVFNDPLLLTFPDPEHSDEEHRSINIGVSSHSRILLVVFTDRKGKLRIISSRKATAKEKKLYETY